MSMNVLTTTLVAIACAAVVTAQAPPTPQVPAPPPSQPPAPAQQAREAKSVPADSLTAIGCLERKAEGSNATPGAIGTAGAVGGGAPGFILTKVMKPTGTAGSSSAAAAPAAATYRLDADDSKLSGHVSHKVEITGTLAGRSADSNASKGGSDDAPRLKVESVKMIALTCTE